MKTKSSKPRVVFNASVIFSSFRSSKGASRALIMLLKQKRFTGVISEIILDEVLKHAPKVPIDEENLRGQINKLFPKIWPSPEEKIVREYTNLIIDQGDAHLFATCKEIRATHLASLDKHHVLILNGKIPNLRIIAPAELLKELKIN